MDVILDRVLSTRKKALAAHPKWPFVCVTWAQSADGMVAAAPGVRTAISGDESMVMTHMLRAVHDAILVGVGTVLADDPRLSCRLEEQSRAVVDAALTRNDLQVPPVEDRSPTAVVLDAKLRTSVHAKLLRQPHCQENSHKPFMFYAVDAALEDAGRKKALSHLVRLDSVSSYRGESRDGSSASTLLCLTSVIETLRSKGVSSVMVEGGASVVSSFLKSGLCDLVIITIAPTLFGTGLSITGKPGRESLSTTQLSDPKWVHCGKDIVLVGTPK